MRPISSIFLLKDKRPVLPSHLSVKNGLMQLPRMGLPRFPAGPMQKPKPKLAIKGAVNHTCNHTCNHTTHHTSHTTHILYIISPTPHTQYTSYLSHTHTHFTVKTKTLSINP